MLMCGGELETSGFVNGADALPASPRELSRQMGVVENMHREAGFSSAL